MPNSKEYKLYDVKLFELRYHYSPKNDLSSQSKIKEYMEYVDNKDVKGILFDGGDMNITIHSVDHLREIIELLSNLKVSFGSSPYKLDLKLDFNDKDVRNFLFIELPLNTNLTNQKHSSYNSYISFNLMKKLLESDIRRDSRIVGSTPLSWFIHSLEFTKMAYDYYLENNKPLPVVEFLINEEKKRIERLEGVNIGFFSSYKRDEVIRTFLKTVLTENQLHNLLKIEEYNGNGNKINTEDFIEDGIEGVFLGDHGGLAPLVYIAVTGGPVPDYLIPAAVDLNPTNKRVHLRCFSSPELDEILDLKIIDNDKINEFYKEEIVDKGLSMASESLSRINFLRLYKNDILEETVGFRRVLTSRMMIPRRIYTLSNFYALKDHELEFINSDGVSVTISPLILIKLMEELDLTNLKSSPETLMLEKFLQFQMVMIMNDKFSKEDLLAEYSEVISEAFEFEINDQGHKDGFPTSGAKSVSDGVVEELRSINVEGGSVNLIEPYRDIWELILHKVFEVYLWMFDNLGDSIDDSQARSVAVKTLSVTILKVNDIIKKYNLRGNRDRDCKKVQMIAEFIN